MVWPAIKKAFTQSEFQVYVSGLVWPRWRPSMVVWHNTAAPDLEQWAKTSAEDRQKGLTPGTTRINNLERYFRDERGWPGAPHLFIAPDYIWVFNPLTAPGVHSPSWNNLALGFELIGDYSREDADTGAGLRVKNNAIFATALLCEALGLNPDIAIKLHKEDPKTTHDCPGRHLAENKFKMVFTVKALMTGGEHGPTQPIAEAAGRRGVVITDDLNVRTGPGVSNPAVTSLSRDAVLTVLEEAKNGSTSWLRVRLPGRQEALWVAGRYVQVE